MKRQRTMALLCATFSVGAFALAGCGPKEEETPTPPATGAGTTTGGAIMASPGAPDSRSVPRSPAESRPPGPGGAGGGTTPAAPLPGPAPQ